MTRDQVVQLFERWQQLWVRRDPAALATMYAADCSVNSPIFGDLKGRSAVEEANRKLFTVFPDWDLVTRDLIVDGDRVALVFDVSATHAGEFMGLPGTGRKAHIHGVRMMRLVDGLIQHETRIYDFTLLLMQVGVLRSKPAY